MLSAHICKTVLTIYFICFIIPAYAIPKPVSLKESVKKGLIKMSACSNGGYMGKCLYLTLKNNTDKDILVKIDPALIFRPESENYQHLVAVGQEVILVPAKQTEARTIQTFCGKSRASAPARDLSFSYWQQGSAEMVKACEYIKEHNLFNSIGQHAIWIFTDGHHLSNVYNPSGNLKTGRDFLIYLSGLLKQEVPQYFTFHQISNNNDGFVYSATISSVYVDIFWDKDIRRNVHVFVYDSNGKLYKEILDGEVINSKGEHNIQVKFDPRRDPKGIYHVQLKDDENRIWVQKTVQIGNSWSTPTRTVQ